MKTEEKLLQAIENRTRFKKYRFNGKMKHYSENSKLYKAYKQSIQFL